MTFIPRTLSALLAASAMLAAGAALSLIHI